MAMQPTTVRRYKTNLNCGNCVAAVAPLLDGEKLISRWSVDTTNPLKPLTVEGDGVTADTVKRLVADAGFKVLGELTPSAPPGDAAKAPVKAPSRWATYYPLLLVFAFLVGVTALVEIRAGALEWERAMGVFMGGFFLVFSFFKLLDLRGFADAFRTYDVVARRFPAYGYVYPFTELLLGVAYLARWSPPATNLATIAVMSLGLVGVSQALLAKREIKCACLGTVFNLPMSFVTFLEDALMAAMALAMLVV